MDNYKEKFSEIYDQYIDKIYRFVYLKVDSQETAQDITSKVFLKGWEAYRKAETSQKAIDNPGAFLYQIARNTVIDHYREKGRTNIVSTEMIPQMADQGSGLHEKAILSADIEAVKSAIQGLKKDYQDIIIYHYIDDMSVPEIAKLMGKTEGSIRVMMHRGLKELKGQVKEI